MTPLVSAIMPTKDRRAFVPGAIECFLSQDWANKELIVVDDGESVEDLVRHPLVRYARVEGTIGAKRNAACQMAHGEYIVHWDDDDWSAPTRISEQVRMLRQSSRPATGYHTLPFAWDEGRRAWLYLGRNGYACGTSLCYLRAYWAGHRFSDVHIGEDNQFVAGLKDRLISDSRGSIVARIHGGATCPKVAMLSEGVWTGAPGECWQEIDYAQLEQSGYPIVRADVQAVRIPEVEALGPARPGERAVALRGGREGRHGRRVSGLR